MSHFRARAVLAGLATAWLLAGSPARADRPPRERPDGTEPAEARSTEQIVRAARSDIDAWVRALLEQDLDSDEPPARPGEPTLSLGVTPSSLTSEAPAVPARPHQSGGAHERPSLAWLVGARLPDFPVRWDPRLYRMLRYYRENSRGRAHIGAWLKRSGRYDTMIRRTFREVGLPEDLAYVAMVESGYDPTARSRAGAVGLWQFVRPTARDYDLTVNRWVDERKDVEKSTQAAARFFKDLYDRLGSWPLAMAAFNMGYGALVRSIRKYNTNDFWLLSQLEAGLPYETVAYVTKVMACSIIAHNPARFGLDTLHKEPPAATVLVEVPGGIGLGRLARAASMRVGALAELNPELRRRRIPPDVRQFSLRLPADKVERFRRRWPDIRPHTGSHAVHVVRFGERVRDVAEMYGTSERRLRNLNELSRSEGVRAGTRLLVPDVEPTPLDRSERPVAAVPETRFEYKNRRQVFYRVIEGDTVEAVSRFFRVTADELRAWNDISTDAALFSGMMLQLFVRPEIDLSRALVLQPNEVKPLIVGSREFFEHHEAQRERVRIRYRVKEGDSLRSLASRFELSVGSIARINGFSRYSDLEPDREIILYIPEDSPRARRHRRR